MFGKKEIIYTDTLAEWRKNKIMEFNFLDKVIPISYISGTGIFTIKYDRPCIIIGQREMYIYLSGGQDRYSFYKSLKNSVVKNEGGEYDSIRVPMYHLIKEDGTKIEAYEVKKYYGEFQAEFEHIEQGETIKKQLEISQAKYQEQLQAMQAHLDKGRKFQTTMIDKFLNT